MNNKKTIILVLDVKGWAFDNIAKYLFHILQDDYNIHTLFSEEYNSYGDLLNNLNTFQTIDLIHFFSRKTLKLILEYIVLKKRENFSYEKFLKAAVTTSVPDHLYSQKPEDLTSFLDTFLFVDNYYTTSKILHTLYLKKKEYPVPWHEVIYDNVLIEAKPNFNTNNKLRVAWIGNSRWGKWSYGKNYDAKGYDTIIKPALELAQKNCEIEIIIIDAAYKKYSQSEVLKNLGLSDILLIASIAEGTPLPLIEAMASGCAIITTEVGIAPEILPEIQRNFIVPRTSESFFQVIKKLNDNREELQKIKQANYKAYKRIFLNEEEFKNKWQELIESSIFKSQNENRIQLKMQILKKIENKLNKPKTILEKIENIILNNNKLKKIIKNILEIKGVNYIVKSTYFFFQSKRHNNNFLNFKGQIENTNTLIIYPEIYPGVKNSTLGLFKDQLLLPLKVNSEFMGLPQSFIKKTVHYILNNGIKKIIFSGGSRINLKLIEKLSTFKESYGLSLYYIYHGSPAQWAEEHHLKEFQIYYNLYNEDKLKGIISLKKDLQIVFNSIGIKSFLLQNFIPLNSTIYQSKGKFTIGLWGASATWIKNPYTQLVALEMLKEEVSTFTNMPCREYISLKNTNKMDITFYPLKIPHEDLMKHIAKTNLTLYITNTECSPMIALESLGLRVPCLVGPTSGLYDDDEYLKDILTVSKVDCPYNIYKAIKRVKEQEEEVKSRLEVFIQKYNQKAQDLKEGLLKSI